MAMLLRMYAAKVECVDVAIFTLHWWFDGALEVPEAILLFVEKVHRP